MSQENNFSCKTKKKKKNALSKMRNTKIGTFIVIYPRNIKNFYHFFFKYTYKPKKKIKTLIYSPKKG